MKKAITFRIDKNEFLSLALIIFLVMPSLIPTTIQFFPILDNLLDAWKILSFILSIVICLLYCKHFISLESVLFVLIFIEFGVSTLINGNMGTWIKDSAKIVTMIQLPVVLYIFSGKKMVLALKTMYYILLIETIGNIISQILCPNGLFYAVTYTGGYFGGEWKAAYYVFGIDNRFVFYYIALLTFGCTLVYLNELRRAHLLLISGLVLFSLLYAWSVGAMIGIAICCLYFMSKNRNKFLPGFLGGSLICVCIFFFVVIFRLQEVFSYWIIQVFHKSLTFSNRTLLWDAAFTYIKKKPWLGYGVTDTTGFLGFNHPHNEILFLLYRGGAISLILHVCFLATCFVKQRKYAGETIYFWYCGIYFSLCMMLLMDSWTSTPFFYAILYMICNVERIVKMKSSKCPKSLYNKLQYL